ncbi:MetQ/NlpA family ABC transporter substrate-binding protein [Kineothrix sedimenti]|uniref:MetQ/NlpA family ABC transporter substrate-binding protein n=1 Tax=Kineothrix sedimenti TaxID=3123317 RepID=A0ABZ3EVS8_9FIRM
MKKRILTAVLATVLAAGTLTACGSAGETATAPAETESTEAPEETAAPAEETAQAEEPAAEVTEKGTITVAATEVPHSEILEAAKPILAEQGWDLQVTVFNDYVQPNEVVESGEFDANYFQHTPYLDSFNEEKGTHLVNVGEIHYEPLGIYAGTESDLANISDGATIAVPNDTTNEARALLLLQDNGIITLKEGAGMEATKNDIAENPHNVEIVELEAAQVARVIGETSFVVLNGNYALQAGLNAQTDALAYETSDSEAAKTYVNVIVVKEGNEGNEGVKALVDVLKSDEIKDFINEKYQGSVVPFE